MVKKYTMAHARQCMMGGCRSKKSDLYSKRASKYDGALYLCPDCAREIGLLNPTEVAKAGDVAVAVPGVAEVAKKKRGSK